MSTCMMNNPHNCTLGTAQPVAKLGLFAVGYESAGILS